MVGMGASAGGPEAEIFGRDIDGPAVEKARLLLNALRLADDAHQTSLLLLAMEERQA
jgi:hypothetical protein